MWTLTRRKVFVTPARRARECAVMGQAVSLARWIGSGRRPVTPGRVLRKADVAAAGAVLGVDVPARLRTMTDIRELHRPWCVAIATGLLQVSDGGGDWRSELWTTGHPTTGTCWPGWLGGAARGVRGGVAPARRGQRAAAGAGTAHGAGRGRCGRAAGRRRPSVSEAFQALCRQVRQAFLGAVGGGQPVWRAVYRKAADRADRAAGRVRRGGRWSRQAVDHLAGALGGRAAGSGTGRRGRTRAGRPGR